MGKGPVAPDGITVDTLPHRLLGRTGLHVSRMGLGLAAVGRPAYITLGREDSIADRSLAAMERRTHSLLDAAIGLGIDYVDTARSYGHAEAFLGTWIGARASTLLAKGQPPVVASKWGYAYVGEWRMDASIHEEKDHGIGRFEAQWLESLAALGRMPNIYQIHSATLETGVLEDRVVLSTLADLKQDGVAIGLSVSGAGQAAVIEAALNVSVDGEVLFGTVQATWNLLDTSAGQALEAAHDAGLGVIVKEGVANGILTSANSALGTDTELRPLAEAARDHGVGPDAVALAAVLANPWVDVALSGAVDARQLKSNLEAIALSDAADLRSVIAPIPATDYWARRARLNWQ